MTRRAGRTRDADLTPAEVRQREIVLGKRGLWLWLATLAVLVIALVADHSAERQEPSDVASQTLFF